MKQKNARVPNNEEKPTKCIIILRRQLRLCILQK